jgi:hypothetical protein
MAKKLYDGVASAFSAAAGAARHVAWYVSYQMNGRAREQS